ncbi:hypothetical protein GIB67_012093 [Kingdonia uniflora]|uniref:Uncharacterized protein n=1 Tax=Kingdonia uniflora TaxID=39325 RepID=A0A7J7LIA9_9MAGN|nr:hypothetical protein GIB67_012093 [Kingdonia uniflora]
MCCLILGLRISPIANKFLFVDPKHMTNFRMRRFPKKKNTYGLKEIDDALKQAKLERHQEDVLRLNLLKFILSFYLPNKGKNIWVNQKFSRIEESIHFFPKLQGWRMTSFKHRQIVTFKKFFANTKLLIIAIKPSETDKQQDLVQEAMGNQIEAPAIGVAPVIGAPAVGVPTVVIPEVGAPTIGSSSSAIEIRAVVVRKEDGKKKKAEPRTWQQKYKKIGEKKKGKGEWQKKSNASKKNKKAEEADVPLKKKVKGTKKEAFTDEQFDHVPLIQLKTLIPKILKKGLAKRVPRKRRAEFPKLENIQSIAENLLQQVASGEGLEVVKDLMAYDDVEVNLEAISSEYGGGLLKWKKGDENDNDDKKDVKECTLG